MDPWGLRATQPSLVFPGQFKILSQEKKKKGEWYSEG